MTITNISKLFKKKCFKPQLQIVVFFLGLICLTIINLTQSEKAYEINYLEPTGMFLEPLGQAYIYEQSWTVVTKLENPGVSETLNFVKSCEKAMATLCSTRENIFGDEECHHWEQDIEFLIQEVQVRSKELDFFFGDQVTKIRTKRGLINMGGWILNKVFGTMDTYEAEDIYNRLNTLEKHDKEHIDIMKKQITLIKSNFQQLTKPIQELAKEQARMEEKIKTFVAFVEGNRDYLIRESQDLHLQVKINDIATYILMRLNAVFHSQSNLFTIVNSINMNKLHPLILKPSDLITINTRIHNYLKWNFPYLNSYVF